MKRWIPALTLLFIVLSLVGAGCVLFTKGQVNAGFAVVPMLVTLVLLDRYHKLKQQ